MIQVDGQLCYSPLPPTSYGTPVLGHGALCKGDIQLWNLMYLSYPQLDQYLQDGVDHVKLVRTFDVIVGAGPKAALYGETNMGLFPYLRDALKQKPSAFLNVLWTMQWPLLPMAMHDPTWIDTIIARAAEIEGTVPVDRTSLITAKSGNITHVKFGK